MPPVGKGARASTARGGGRGKGHGGGGEPEKDESERWLVTYADMLTVMLALFIVLFAISALNQSKFKELKYSLAAVFGDGSIGVLDGSPAINDAADDPRAVPPTLPQVPVTTDAVPAVPNLGGFLDGEAGYQHGATESAEAAKPPETALIDDTGSAKLNAAIKVEINNFAQIEKSINGSLKRAGMEGAVEFSVDERGLIITVVTNALVFPGNSAHLLKRGQKLLAVITPPLIKVPNSIEVDGYTNQLDVSTDPYPSGWELSSARASAVVRYLESHGLKNRSLSAVGYSDQRPLVPPDDPRSVTRNRRVEIVVLSSLPSTAGKKMAAAAHQDGIPGPSYATTHASAADSASGPGSGPQSGPAS